MHVIHRHAGCKHSLYLIFIYDIFTKPAALRVGNMSRVFTTRIKDSYIAATQYMHLVALMPKQQTKAYQHNKLIIKKKLLSVKYFLKRLLKHLLCSPRMLIKNKTQNLCEKHKIYRSISIKTMPNHKGVCFSSWPLSRLRIKASR